MIVRRFLLWSRVAPAAPRADAVRALADAFLHAAMTQAERREAEAALIAMLDDPSPLVRRAMAEALAGAPQAPRPVVIALAGDQGDIAAPVLSRSPVLTDADLVDCAAIGDELAQTAIAMRASLGVPVAAALAEVARPAALVALADNHGVMIPTFSLKRMVERHGADPALREALLARPNLAVEIRLLIVTAVADALSSFAVGCDWMTPERSRRATREARERTTIALAGDEPDGVLALVRHLREAGQLNAGLILRALLSGELALVEGAIAELAGLPPRRVAALMHDRRGAGFAALYRKAGLPPTLEPGFAAALAAWHEAGAGAPAARLSRAMIERVITACETLDDQRMGPLMALLRRFEAEAAREEARDLSKGMADDAAFQLMIGRDQEALILEGTDAGPPLMSEAA